MPDLDDPVAAVDHHARHGKAAQDLHQRRGAVGDAGHLVGLPLDRRDVGVEAFAQDILEREGLDDADALQRLLQRLQDADPAGELVLGDAANALDHLAQHQHRGREHDERHEREQRVSIDHDADQPDQREEIAADRVDEQIEDLRRRRRAGHEPGGEFRGVAIGKKPMLSLSSLLNRRRWFSAMM